ncbi:hypothetical protein B0H11DRAFT_2193022 [Mycena galericulata]|nr:hypothetical protein B0H11DRAFT_2193022 [Mycena galericulata]
MWNGTTLGDLTRPHIQMLMNSLPEVPNTIDLERIGAKHDSQHEAYDTAATARRAALDQLGFLYWLLTVNENWYEGLPTALSQFVTDLRLFERHKRGMLLRLDRDHPTFNFVHMIRHDVPFHYAWTSREEKNDRLFRFSRIVLDEYLSCSRTRDGDPVPLEELPHYHEWRDKLYRYDDFRQDRAIGGRADWIRFKFFGYFRYYLIRHEGWGAQHLKNRLEIRAYSEQYNARAWHFKNNTYVVFFQQFPLLHRAYTPPHQRRAPLYWFGNSEAEDAGDEEKFYSQDEVLIRERWMPRFSPMTGRVFDSQGRLTSSSSGTRANSDPGLEGGQTSYRPYFRDSSRRETRTRGRTVIPPGARAISSERHVPLYKRLQSPSRQQRAARTASPLPYSRPEKAGRSGYESGEGRRRSSRSLSPMSDDTENQFMENWVHRSRGEEESLSSKEGNSQESSSSKVMPGGPGPDPREEWSTPVGQIRTKDDHLRALISWGEKIVEVNPHLELVEGAKWDAKVLRHGILVFDDPRAEVRMRFWSSMFEQVKTMEDLLTIALQFAIPFWIYYEMVYATDAINLQPLEHLSNPPSASNLEYKKQKILELGS